MRRGLGVAGVLSLAICAGANTAAADARTWNVCGGSRFASCASVGVLILGQSVTLRLWNLSGFNGTDANTVFTAVGFAGVGTAEALPNSLTMSGPVRSGNSPLPWRIRNDVSTPGMFLDLLSATPGNGTNNGIASGCANNIPAAGQFWQNPCRIPLGIQDPGYVQLDFTIRGSWDLSNTIVTVHGNNGDRSTECITGGALANCFGPAVPEPVTMTLMLTGLAGMGGIGVLRRRKKNDVGNA